MNHTTRRLATNLRRGARALLCLSAGVLLATALLTACASNRPVAGQLDDAVIATKIEAKLTADPEINAFNVDVDVREGVVRLSGVVEKERARSEAEGLARRTAGVRSVVNDIEIGHRPVSERLSDSALTAKIKAKFTADPEINPFSIDVDTIDGVVTLSGRVADHRRKQEAAELTRNTEGVREVRNRLEIGNAKDSNGDS
jgi:hyperosmotically inducible protein